MAKLCSQCGTKPDDWKDDRFALVPNPTRCLGCEAIEIEREQIPDSEKGIHIPLIPREVAEQMELTRGDGLMGSEDDGGPEQEGGLL